MAPSDPGLPATGALAEPGAGGPINSVAGAAVAPGLAMSAAGALVSPVLAAGVVVSVEAVGLIGAELVAWSAAAELVTGGGAALAGAELVVTADEALFVSAEAGVDWARTSGMMIGKKPSITSARNAPRRVFVESDFMIFPLQPWRWDERRKPN